MPSIFDRVGNALKAGAKSAADSILTPSSGGGNIAPSQPTNQGYPPPTPEPAWKKWIIPSAAAAALGLVFLTRGGSRR